MKQIKVSSTNDDLMDFDVVRQEVSPFRSYRKDNYIVKYLHLTKPFFTTIDSFSF